MSISTVTHRLDVTGYPLRMVLAGTAGTCLIASFVADLAYLGTADAAWTIYSAWLVLAGAVANGFAVMAAFLSAVRQRGHRRELSWTGFFGFCGVWGLSLTSAIIHSYGVAGFPAGLVLSSLAAALAMSLGQAHWKAIRSASSYD